MQESKRIFIGDSLTMRHNWSNFKAANMGIDGDTTQGILSRLHYTKNAQTVVLMIGVNDILNEINLNKIQRNYTKILESFSSGQKVYVLSLLPVIDAKETKAINQSIKNLNHWLKEEVKKHNCHYLNFYPAFLDAQKKGLKKSYTTDGIHLTPAAYKMWEKLLKEALKPE